MRFIFRIPKFVCQSFRYFANLRARVRARARARYPKFYLEIVIHVDQYRFGHGHGHGHGHAHGHEEQGELILFIKRQSRSGKLKRSLSACKVASRLTAAMESVKGIFLGQTRTQFWLFPQSLMPPSSIIGLSRRALCVCPTGLALKSLTCEIAAGPIKWESLFT